MLCEIDQIIRQFMRFSYLLIYSNSISLWTGSLHSQNLIKILFKKFVGDSGSKLFECWFGVQTGISLTTISYIINCRTINKANSTQNLQKFSNKTFNLGANLAFFKVGTDRDKRFGTPSRSVKARTGISRDFCPGFPTLFESQLY